MRLLPLLLVACTAGGPASSGSPEGSSQTASATATTTESASASPPASASASVAPPGDVHLAGSAIMKDIEWLAGPEQKGRRSGSEDEARAAAWLAKALDEAKIPPWQDQRIVPFTYSANAQRKSANVVGVIEPHGADRREVLVLGAHYDHLGERNGKTYFGAEDNASGTAVVLAVARALEARRGELGRRVVIAFFGAEEMGLHGSQAMVKTWDFKTHPVTAMVNVDMIGRPLVDQPALWLTARLFGVLSDVEPAKAVGVMLPDTPNPELQKTVTDACAAHGIRAVYASDLPDALRAKVEQIAKGRSDHAPFDEKKVPFAFFSSGESTDYHEPTDTPDRLTPAILEGRARAILDVVIALSK